MSMIHRRRTPGVTLLELILALALATIVMAAIAWALQLHLKAFDTRRTNIEEAQLARAVLKLIGDDLRSVVAHNAIDFTDAARLATTQAPQLDLDEEDLTGDGGDGATIDTGQQQPPKDLTADLTPSSIPGIYGNQYQLLMDVSRLPRIEDFMVTVGSSDIPSDVKTISYYLRPDAGPVETSPAGTSIFDEQQTLASSSSGTAQGWGRGLMRRALDRSVTQYATASGDVSRLDQQGELVALEVVALEFRYFDGASWLTEWDTQANGGLPQAIEVAMAISGGDEEFTSTAAQLSSISPSAGVDPLGAQSNSNVRIYSQIIRIPAAAPLNDAQSLQTDAG